MKIIEDFDRGSLEKSIIYNSMLFRFPTWTSYVVVLGYNTGVEKALYIEMAMKLNARIIMFDLSHSSLGEIVNQIYSNPPVKSGEWIKLFPARKLISIISKIEKNSFNLTDEQKFFRYIGVFFNEIVSILQITDLKKIKFSDKGLGLQLADISQSEAKVINSFLISIDQTRFLQFTKGQQGAANWGQVFMSNLLINGNYSKSTIEEI